MSRALTAGRAAALLLLGGAAAGCASTGDPPGGPPDSEPPLVVRVAPDSGAVLTAPPDEVEIVLDEVVNERIAAPRPDIGGAVIFSPATGEVRVRWHRNRLSVRPRGGFRPGRVYRIELLPVLTDLRQNRMRAGRVIVFSTGPEIPGTSLQGALVDWVAGRAGPGALVEAVLLPDSLPYRALTDSAGGFRLDQIPAGTYLVFGVLDPDGDRRRGPREAYDTARVSLADTASVELYAFPHDSTGPRLRSVDLQDSVTVRLVFDRPLDPSHPLDASKVRVTAAADTTARIAVRQVLTGRAQDTVRAPAAPLAPAGRDSSRAMRMIARRPPPSDTRLVRLAAPLAPETRYVIVVAGARSLSGVAATARAQLSVPRPRSPASPGSGAQRSDSARSAADTARSP